ncbi:hypothetical protein ACGC1H_004256 [Rhizoctonia solani]
MIQAGSPPVASARSPEAHRPSILVMGQKTPPRGRRRLALKPHLQFKPPSQSKPLRLPSPHLKPLLSWIMTGTSSNRLVASVLLLVERTLLAHTLLGSNCDMNISSVQLYG